MAASRAIAAVERARVVEAMAVPPTKKPPAGPATQPAAASVMEGHGRPRGRRCGRAHASELATNRAPRNGSRGADASDSPHRARQSLSQEPIPASAAPDPASTKSVETSA